MCRQIRQLHVSVLHKKTSVNQRESWKQVFIKTKTKLENHWIVVSSTKNIKKWKSNNDIWRKHTKFSFPGSRTKTQSMWMSMVVHRYQRIGLVPLSSLSGDEKQWTMVFIVRPFESIHFRRGDPGMHDPTKARGGCRHLFDLCTTWMSQGGIPA